MTIKLGVYILSVLLLPIAARAGTTYYVSSSSGIDTNNGLSSAVPWATLTKVNQTTFFAGDTILFKRGDQWTGQLWPKGLTTTTNYIKIDMWGTTGGKPKIIGAGAGGWCGLPARPKDVQGAVYLLNQPGWEIRNLDVDNTGGTQTTSPAPVDNKCQVSGIKVHNTTGVASHIVISNNYVHDVTGLVEGFYGANAGIAITSSINPSANPPADPTWNDVTISNNVLSNIDRIGIYVGPNWQHSNDPSSTAYTQLPQRNNNITISGNTIDAAGADGILTFVASNVTIASNVISNSGSKITSVIGSGQCGNHAAMNGTSYANCASVAIWTHTTDHSVIQDNEVYHYGWPCSLCSNQFDGTAFDADDHTTNQIIQYNYSHDNWGGLFLMFSSGVNNIRLRYNISYNDGFGNGVLHFNGFPGSDPIDINNNVFYLSGSQPAGTMMFGGDTSTGIAYIYNNVFYTTGSIGYPTGSALSSGVVFDYNAFYEPNVFNEPSDNHAFRYPTDPRFVDPTAVATGIANVGGLKLGEGSPAIVTGTSTGLGIDGLSNLGPRDFWGNPVSATGAPSIGAYCGIPINSSQNLALGATIVPYTDSNGTDNSYDTVPWGKTNVNDGQINSLHSTYGYSSELGHTASYGVDLEVDLSTVRTFNKIILYPRSDAGWGGAGFPVDFSIQVWDGANWVTRLSYSNYVQSYSNYVQLGSQPQIFTWTPADTTDKVRIHATALRAVENGYYYMQLAEIELYNN